MSGFAQFVASMLLPVAMLCSLQLSFKDHPTPAATVAVHSTPCMFCTVAPCIRTQVVSQCKLSTWLCWCSDTQASTMCPDVLALAVTIQIEGTAVIGFLFSAFCISSHLSFICKKGQNQTLWPASDDRVVCCTWCEFHPCECAQISPGFTPADFGCFGCHRS